MISNSSKYAIKSLVYIVNNASEDHKLLVKDIARETQVPRHYLSKILQQLSAKNYLSSTKGPGGGFFITKKQLKTSLIDIVVETEGKDRLSRCILNYEQCDAQNPCPIHDMIAPAKDALRHQLKMITLENLGRNEIAIIQS
jgi:Rrf2 family protein